MWMLPKDQVVWSAITNAPMNLSIAMPLNKWQSLCPMGRLIFMHPVADFILDSTVSSLNTTIGSLQTKNTGSLPVHSQNVRVYREVTGISRVYGWVTVFFPIV